MRKSMTYAEGYADKVQSTDDGYYEYSDLTYMFNQGFKHAIRCVKKAYEKDGFDKWLNNIIEGCGGIEE